VRPFADGPTISFLNLSCRFSTSSLPIAFTSLTIRSKEHARQIQQPEETYDEQKVWHIGPAKMNSPDNHFTGVYNSNTIAVIVCSALALYNAVELELLVFTTFKAYRGLYFWSLVLASLGIIPYVLGYFIEYFQLSWIALGITIDTVGWTLMVTGQSVVLYSRLWIVFHGVNHKLLNAVKWMIIINAIVFHGGTCSKLLFFPILQSCADIDILFKVVVFGSHYGHNQKVFGKAYDCIERIQMVGFCIQEFILSGLYIWKALDIIKSSKRKQSHHIMWQILSINVIIIVLDIGLLAIEFLSLHVLQQTIKGFTYSVKIKLELAVLNKLVELSTNNSKSIAFGDTSDFLDPSKNVSDTARSTPAFSSSMKTDRRWKSDLERLGAQRIENIGSPSESISIQPQQSGTGQAGESDEDFDIIKAVSTTPDPRLNVREKGSGTGLLYANALRGMAN
jgi:hypothetical protein